MRRLYIWGIGLLLAGIGIPAYALHKEHPITIYNKEGKALLQLKADISETTKEKQQGLMFRKTLPEKKGMFFLYRTPTSLKMWMKNTYIPLDVLFINNEGRIIYIVKNVQPFDETPQGPTEKSSGFLEVPAGTVESYGISLGNTISPLPFYLLKE